MARFHARTGALVTLSNDNKTAQRNHPAQEFNNGVVLGAEPLRDNQLFEVKIDRKVNSWSGSIEIGLTTCDPANLNFPTSATGFREGTWVMSGCSILKDGHSTIEEYGRDLDQLAENDRVGVLRTSGGVLHFFVNGIDQGPAASNIPSKVYAVIDMYGKCAQVTVMDDNNRDMVISNDITNEAIAEATYVHSNERLLFHERCGTLVKLTNNRRTSERLKPLDEFNNGVVMTNRPLKDDEVFEIRLDRLVDKWSGSIEVGITTHNPSNLEFPATMTNMRSGTIMMSGCGILTNGKGTRREYGEYNLDELSEGDRIALVRKSSGALHYFINGIDQGVAASRTPQLVWGVVDLYGMAVKVTILDRSDPNYVSYETFGRRVNNYLRNVRVDDPNDNENQDESQDVEKLTFHMHCGTHAAVINGQRTAHRPNALDDFNNGVVLTSRHLRPNEMFEVRLDKMVDKWAGSIEIGVTTHSPLDLDFPSTMTNMRCGTWMMTGNGVMHNGTTVIDEYGQNLDRLKEGDRVGCLRKDNGTVHFFVNGVDQGPAASSVPADVYGVIDLYGQAAQATIVDNSDPPSMDEVELAVALGAAATPVPAATNSDDLRFHHVHGHNAIIINGGKTASRPHARGEFNDAIVTSNRPLRDNELFEVSIDKMVDRWSGSIEAGVTLIRPEDLDFPNTMTDIEYDTWMLSGSAIMQDGSTIRNGYMLDLDTLQVNSRIGMMRCSDGTLHYFLDGVDQGVACHDIAPGVFAVIDLYGQCAQVTITSGSGVRPAENRLSTCTADLDPSLTSPLSAEMCHRFSLCCGKNISIKNNGCTACRVRNFNNGLVFSADPLKSDEMFEIRVDQLSRHWSGSLQMGVTTMAISDSTPLSVVPANAVDMKSKTTWIMSGSEVRKNGVIVKENYGPSLERLEVNNRVAVKRCSDGTLHMYINGEDLGVAATNVPKNVFAVIDLYGCVDAVTVISSAFTEVFNSCSRPPSIPSSDGNESLEDEQDEDTAEAAHYEFHINHGKNIQLSNHNLTAFRSASYNQGIVVSHKPLCRNQMFRVRLDQLNTRWSSSLVIGVIGFSPEKYKMPSCAISMKRTCWLVHGSSVFMSGIKVKERYGPNLDKLHSGHVVGIMVDDDSNLHLYVNGVDQGVAAKEISSQCYALVDLYGQCERVTVVMDDSEQNVQPLDYREKADLEDSVNEKMSFRPQEPSNSVKNCEYQNMCSRYKGSLALPEGYFQTEQNRCYCETCHKVRGDEPYFKRGEPPKDCALPFGWCKFALRIPAKAEAQNVTEKWHVAYHGTHPGVLRKILDSADLLMTGHFSGGGGMLKPQPVHFDEKNTPEEQQDIKQIQLSPTIRYSGSQTYAPKYEFRDPKTKKLLQARIAFQVHMKPGSYKIGPQSIGANEQIDPKFSNSELEWSTKERGATILSALLIKLE